MNTITVTGAGLAGSEAALQLAAMGFTVTLHEMRPGVMTPAHRTGLPAELVCSNSFRSDLLHNAPGLLKEELRRCGSFLMRAAEASCVPAGGALAVDREVFSGEVEKMLMNSSKIRMVHDEVTSLPPPPVIIAAGPLASPALTEDILRTSGGEFLYFYDAIAPVITGESINMEKAFFQSRYSEPGDTDYLNCPFNEHEYFSFVKELKKGSRVSPREFEDELHFQGCMPVEAIADSGEMSLAFGPMKPVGLQNPRTGARPFAVVQLRRENLEGTSWNLVGFQTKLTYPEQKRIFRMIPGLENAEFLRLGSMHRNTFINGPKLLDSGLQLKTRQGTFFAGQITGVEGYIESIASGLLAALSVAGVNPMPPPETALGSLLRFSTGREEENYQPSNINYGLFPPMEKRARGGKKARREAMAARALDSLEKWLLSVSPLFPAGQGKGSS